MRRRPTASAPQGSEAGDPCGLPLPVGGNRFCGNSWRLNTDRLGCRLARRYAAGPPRIAVRGQPDGQSSAAAQEIQNMQGKCTKREPGTPQAGQKAIKATIQNGYSQTSTRGCHS